MLFTKINKIYSLQKSLKIALYHFVFYLRKSNNVSIILACHIVNGISHYFSVFLFNVFGEHYGERERWDKYLMKNI